MQLSARVTTKQSKTFMFVHFRTEHRGGKRWSLACYEISQWSPGARASRRLREARLTFLWPATDKNALFYFCRGGFPRRSGPAAGSLFITAGRNTVGTGSGMAARPGRCAQKLRWGHGTCQCTLSHGSSQACFFQARPQKFHLQTLNMALEISVQHVSGGGVLSHRSSAELCWVLLQAAQETTEQVWELPHKIKRSGIHKVLFN